MSSQNAEVSDFYSQGIVRPVVVFLAQVTGLQALSPADPGFAFLLDDIDSAFREVMHAVEYLFLGVLVGIGLGRRTWVAFFVCVAYSLSDEVHQLFVPGRAFQLQDLALDALGSALGVWTVKGASSRRDRRAMGGSKVSEGATP
jgi:VanZ family protein